MKTRLYIFILTAFLVSGLASAQDAHFSMYYAASLYLNPALAGNEKGVAFNSNYRTQWRSATLPYTTNQVTVIIPWEQRIPKKKHMGGFGFSAYNDRAGDGNLKTTGVNATLTRNWVLTQNGFQNVSIGVQAGFIQKSVDFAALQWGSQFNPYIGFDATVTPNEALTNASRVYPDISAGVMYYYNPDKSYLFTGVSGFSGLSIAHINNPNESIISGQISNLPPLIKYHGGFEVHTTDRLNVSPNILIMYQNALLQTNAGLYMSYLVTDAPIGTFARTHVIFGTWYRLKDAFIFSMAIDNPSYTIGFSYDMNNSTLRYATRGRGAYEISLMLRRVQDKKSKRFSTPRI